MDKNLLIFKIEQSLKGSVLDVRRFGRTTMHSVWLEIDSIQKVGAFLKVDLQFRLDWLENLTVVEFESALVFSYFLRSTVTPYEVVLRASVMPLAPEQLVQFPSVREVWSMAGPMEEEAEELFGIEFQRKGRTRKVNLLPSHWVGFPMRKTYKMRKA